MIGNSLRERVQVQLGTHGYPVLIGTGLIDQAGREIMPLLSRPRVAIVTDETVAKLCLRRLTHSLVTEGISHCAMILPPGEATKSWQPLIRTTEWLLGQQVERGDLIIALGGGVIGDLTGFAAAILRRGTRFVQIPTTLLAQVDSSVGGKTGINTVQGKNLIGSFHQPELVLADTGVLDHLPRRDLRAGYGEILKCALLGDAGFFAWLEKNGPDLVTGDASARHHAIRRSVEMKAEVVARDETESGDRALLNLGHTFAHALERATGYSDRLLHGESVAIGCMLAFELARHLDMCPQEDMQRLRSHLARMGMKSTLSDIGADLPSPQVLVEFMQQDKKAEGGEIRFILPNRIGQCRIAGSVPHGALLHTLVRSATSRTLH
ncbi:3-dehydroquinate synthase [Paenirhodobacter populi]|uniref:3-dehydroquinate synthase n=1 Tax=Paenirhodobacter populi TaxID=2306993 RepID=A0A443JG27_9RHOB|nr:3-dehydroquinate synthase [Sinirhodobacter populi]RWR19526.1 3-dehydroquinate synthase [Sinirhodobacter populi]